MTDIQRDDQHRYYHGDRRVLGVTECMESAGYIDTRWFDDAGRIRGTYVHEACQYLLEGDLAWDALEPDYRPYVESFALWVSDMRPEVIALEKQIFNAAYGYAGQLDALLRINGDVWLLDWKSGAVAPWVGIQTAAYEHALDMAGIRRGAIKLMRNGKRAKVVPLAEEQDWPDFLHALGTFNCKLRLAGGWEQLERRAAA